MSSENLLAATSNLPKVLVSQQLANSETTQYTCPSSSAVRIATATLCNTSSSAVTVSVSLVKTGGSAGSSNRVLTSYSIAAYDSISLTEIYGAMLGPGDFISAIASAATSVAFVLTGAVSS